MQELIDKVKNELRSTWRFRRYALAIAWGVCLFGWLVVYAIPDRYEARARVNVDTRTPLKPLLEGLAVNQDVEAQLNMVRQALLGRAKLELVAQQVGMDLVAKTPQERDGILTSLSSRIDIALEPPAIRDPRIPNTFYRITFTDRDKQTALRVVDVLLNSFVENTMGSERTGTASAQRFLRDQLTEYDRNLAQAEQRLADFKKKNVGMVPGEEGGYFQRLQAEMQEVKRLSAALAIANSKRDELQRQLRGETPFTASDGTTVTRTTNGQQGPQDTASRIQETQARLDDMLLRYTDKHPEVIAARETLQQLRTRQKEELAALKRGDAGAAAVAGAASNPIYQNIQLQLNTVEVEMATLRQQLADHKRNETELRKVVDTVPEVEAEYARLTRDYDVTKAQYNALLERSERAKLSGAADKTGVVAFDIVDPPVVSFEPVFPNRPLFLAAVLAMGLGAGAAVSYLMHLMKPVFSDSRSLADLTGLPVLGSVTRTWLDKQRAEMRMGLLRYSAMSGLLFVLFIVAVLAQEPAARLIRQALSERWPEVNAMSLVERALKKIQEQRAAAPPSVARPTGHASVVAGPLEETVDIVPRLTQPVKESPVKESPVREPIAPPRPTRTIRIDHAALRAAEILPPADKERQLANEYRHIKRPLIARALGRGEQQLHNGHLIMMASALPGDGKTFTSINLALSLALEKDISVVLVDADVAKPHISRLFQVDSEPGLLDVLCDETLDVESVILPTNVPRLSVVPAGKRSETAAELLASGRMAQIVAALGAHDPSRIILLDSPPLLLTSESRVLAGVVGQVVMVVRAGETPQRAVFDAIDLLGEGKAVSLVLNQSDEQNAPYYHQYYGQDGPGAP